MSEPFTCMVLLPNRQRFRQKHPLGKKGTKFICPTLDLSQSFMAMLQRGQPWLLFPTDVYAGVTGVSVYIHEDYPGKDVGSALLQKLITESEANNIWTLQSVIFPENMASIALHENLGFRKIGYREKIGKMDGVWRDTVLMERRSKITGQD